MTGEKSLAPSQPHDVEIGTPAEAAPPKPGVSQDALAVLVLVALWLLFFWRLFAPFEADQASLKKGDFSGQFVAFAAYQYNRLSQGQVPLWNPYNNGGLPFLADTQSAVFYPPRLVTIALSSLSGGWTYHTLELEMAFHALAYSLMMYAFVRRLTLKQRGSAAGALAAALVAAYGGFMTGYPPLQLALLEAAVWLPLAALGVFEATRAVRPRWAWLLLAGLALGLSWMAGHPQTSYFLTLLLAAYLAYRVQRQHYSWAVFAGGAALFGLLAGGLAAVQLLPGLEYLPRTARIGFSYDAKGNGFPFRDLAQFVFPGLMSQFSPLYIGVSALPLVFVALWRRVPGAIFWGVTAVVALGLSFGANSAVFPALYNLLPGLRFFRGQERAAYLVAGSLAVLAGLGLVHVLNWDKEQWPNATKNIRRLMLALAGLCSAAVVIVFNEWLNNQEGLADELNIVVFGALAAGLSVYILREVIERPRQALFPWLLVGLLVFDLFSVNMDSPATYDPVPPGEQLVMPPARPPLLDIPFNDADGVFRVDGYRGLHDNYGSLYGLKDMRGISPLWLDGPYHLVEPDLINPLAWELFAVRYVYTDWQEMPVPSQIVASGTDRYGEVNLHRLDDPRPFAWLVYDYATAKNAGSARGLVAAPGFNPRRTVVLDRDPGIAESEPPGGASAVVTEFLPEAFTIAISTPADAVLTLAHPDYPGWHATINGQPADILRAYGALSAVVVPAGEHTVRLTYDPVTFRLGALVSLLAWGVLGILCLALAARSFAARQR